MKRSSPEQIRAWKQRSKPLKRGKGPRRRGPRINSPYGTKRGKSLHNQREIDIANSQAFKQAAREQRVCAVCGRGDSWDAHHVIEKAYLKANNLPLFNTENSLRTCDEWSKNDCHGKHTRGFKRIPLHCLTDRNIRYAFYILGASAYDYLTARYSGQDERVERALEEAR